MAAVVITDYAATFSEVWPGVARTLRARLLRSGVPEAVVDDVLQDTAIAALDRQVRFESADELLAWTTTVSRRLAIAEYRRCARVDTAPELPSRSVPPIDDEVIARLAAERVLRAIPELSPADRLALAPTDATSRTEAVRDNVRRHRARARLRLIAGAVWGAVVAVVARVRGAADTSALALAGATALTVTVLVLPFSADRPAPDAPTDSNAMVPDGSVLRPKPSVERLSWPEARHRPTPTVTGAAAAKRSELHDSPSLPQGAVQLPTPNGDQAEVGSKPDAPRQASACAYAAGAPVACVAIPVPPTPLDDL